MNSESDQAVVGDYPSRTAAYERALVLAAMDLEYWIERDAERFVLCVASSHADAAARELARYERERVETPVRAELPKHSHYSLPIAAMVMAGFLAAQESGGAPWENAGVCAADKVMQGEWWRTLTALTLHADLSHFGANLAAGLLFLAFLLPLLGTGWTWFGTIAAGGIGNWLNAWGHRGELHHSIGASTAVFGALGLLVGAQIVSRIITLRKVSAREVWLPAGAGLALLAFLGVGDEQTDYTAHFFGLLAGVPLGAMFVALDINGRTARAVDVLLCGFAPALLAFAWVLALRRY